MNRRTQTSTVVPTTHNTLALLLVVGLTGFNVTAHSASESGTTAPTSESYPRMTIVPGGVSLGTSAGLGEAPLLPAENHGLLEDSSANDEKKEKKDGEWLIAPVPSLNSAVGWMVALPVVRVYRPSWVDAEDPAWMTGIGGFYAENDSAGGGVFHKMNLGGDRWRLMGAAFGTKIYYDYYGIGADSNPNRTAVPLHQKAVGGLVEVLREVANNFYAGFRFIGVETNVSVDLPPETIPPELLPPDYGIDLTLMNLAPRMVFDTRDNEFYPTTGKLIEGEVQVSSESLGSDLDYQRYELTWNQYRALGARGVLAVRVAAKFAAGDAPFFVYPSFGQGADLRGYTAGTYRDRMLIAGQVEYRLRLRKRLGVVAFGGVGGVGPALGEFDTALPSAGVGLRFVVAPENDISLRVDIAWGRDDRQVYVGIGEAF